ncbi:MAG: HAMP domain-containing sensor histidine kinase [Aerococcus sp.]|nr:HAMP domain-containing sensor histidine kinase [Aerococcus sp.]
MIELVIGGIIGIMIGYLWHYQQVKGEVKHLENQLKHSEKFPSQHLLVTQHQHTGLEPLMAAFNVIYHHVQTQQVLEEQHFERLRQDLGNISHDLRTPLTAIIGYLELIQAEESHTAEAEAHLNYAIKRADRLKTLIQDLFYLSKLENHTLDLATEPLPIERELQNVLASHYPLLQAAPITIETMTIEPTPPVLTNAAAVDRLLTNLIINIANHGSGNVSITHQLEEGQAVTRFTNAIAPTEKIDLERIFDRHYTGTTERNQDHSGLGLAIAHELCLQLGHTLTASMPTKTTFQIEIRW